MTISNEDKSPNRWIIILEEDPESGELVLPLTDEMLDLAGFQVGDPLIWSDNKDGSWSLTKLEKVDEE
jgi:hypothetical protein